VKRSKHSLSNFKLLTGNQGELLPIGMQEVLPGDTFRHSTTLLLRMNTLVAPVMHPVQARVHHWFVPFRLIWDDWENFITGGPDGLNNSTLPYVTTDGTNNAVGSLLDYLGAPTTTSGLDINALPLRAYALIYNEFYRDQDLQTALTIDTTDGSDTTTNTTLKRVCWEKDFFTSARDETQKGTEVTLPLGTEAPVTGIGKNNQTYTAANQSVYETGGSGTTTYNPYTDVGTTADTQFYVQEDPNNSGYPNIKADLSNATAATINQLREAMALQKYAEARMLYGSRYTEYLKYLGVNPSDSRLQRPEYLGGGKQTVQFSEVLATAEGTSTNVGDFKGHGIGAVRSNKYQRSFNEHGIVLSMLSVRPKTMYTQSIPKFWLKDTKEDFWQKELQHVGQQEILNKEIYSAHATPNGVFGYQNRYDEYRKVPSTVAAEFRSGEALEHFHLARSFSSDPTLNSTFVECNPSDRIFADTNAEEIIVQAYHNIKARRLVHKNGNPI
jgi:hypothetical protein